MTSPVPRRSISQPLVDEPVTATAHAGEIDRELRLLLAQRMLVQASVADATHAALAALAMLLVARWVGGATMATLFAAVVIAVVLRRTMRNQADASGEPQRMFTATRVGSALLAAVWGVIVLVTSWSVPGEVVAWMAVILAGLVSGASATLLPDPVSFYLFEGLVLGPLLLAVLTHDTSPVRLHGATLIALYGLVMLALFRRAHANMVAQLRVGKKLEITERAAAESRKAAERLARIVEATSDHVGVAGADRMLQYLNRAGRQMLGIGEREDVSRINVADFIARGFVERMDTEVVPTLMRDGVWRGDTVMHDRSGHAIPVSLVTLAHLGPNGGLDAVSAIARDMTEQVAARNALHAARDAAEQASNAKSAFLANTSHEIRTPLNGILGMVELLRDTELTPTQRHSLELIAASGDTLLNTINDLLDLSKIEAGQLALEETTFDLHQLALDATRLFASRAADNEIELVTDVDPSLPRWVVGDPHRLRQVVSNLVSNAIKFTKRGSVVVEVRETREVPGDRSPRFAREKRRVHVIVRDTGIGIAPEHVTRIFEPFLQVESSTTRHYGGTGLGLPIARRLVRLMGGDDVELESVPGQGSTFSFSLPLREAPTPREMQRPEPAELRGVRVLVVDDHPVNRRVLSGAFETAGCRVDVAGDAAQALASLREAAANGQRFALAVSDVQMPGRDGFQLAQDIRADATLARMAIMLLTSATRPGDAQRARDLGVSSFLQKPVSRSELLDAARAVLGGTVDAGARDTPRIAPTAKRMRVLVAEDNPINQEVAAGMLRRRGHAVEIVGSGAEAVSAVRDHGAFDVVLMDLQMPDMDGVEATQRIRALPAPAGNVRVVALTASVFAAERERCAAAGMNGFVAKPFKPEELFEAVESGESGAVRREVGSGSGGAAELWSGGTPVDLTAFRQMLADADLSAAGDPMLKLFLRDVPKRIAELNAAIASRDGYALGRAAHALKSAAGNIRALRLAKLLGDAEQAANAGDVPVAAELAREAVNESERVCDFLDSALPA
ncbi:MAG TPA: response regulator [Gemmatimonadaceae bacterium]|nr:response regulator [Gemmatimonadaceae bacterium]